MNQINRNNELEQIQQGLEDFLEKEIGISKEDSEQVTVERKTSKNTTPKRATTNETTPKKTATNKATPKKTTTAQETTQKTATKRMAKQENSKQTVQKQSAGKQNRTPAKAASKKTSAAEVSSKKASTRKITGKKKKHRFRKFLIVVTLLIAIAGAGWYKLVDYVYGKMNFNEVESVVSEPVLEDDVVNILLIGNDSRQNGQDGRSDAMILLSLSNRTKSIYMTSLLRDMYVDIPGHGGNRLNAAYSYGGPELLMKTVEENFDIPVNRYVSVNFEAFAGLVDAVGGVELELTAEEIEYVNGYLVEYNMLTDRPQGTDNMDPADAGLVHLNGAQALAYTRNRYLGTDFGRTERQRKVLTAMFEKLPSALLTNGGNLLDELLPNLTTNLTQKECLQLSLMAGKVLTYDLVSDNIPQSGTYKNASIRGMSVLEVDFEANIQYLKEKLYAE